MSLWEHHDHEANKADINVYIYVYVLHGVAWPVQTGFVSVVVRVHWTMSDT